MTTEVRDYTYAIVPNLKYGGKIVYYRKPYEGIITAATIFNDKYTYFYKDPKSSVLKPLGKFQKHGMRSTGNYSYDYDYPVYEFENNDYYQCENQKYIYCIELQNTRENMVLIEDLLYEDYPIYYESKNI